MYIGLTKEGFRCLLIPLHEDEEAGIPIKTKSIASRTRSLAGPSGLTRYLEVLCLERGLNSRFGVIADDIVHAVEKEDEIHPSGAVLAVLARWRLLVTGSPRRLTEPELIGLWGELYVLGLLSALNRSAADIWRGPFREIHDFRNGDQLIEVKTGLYSSHDSIIVNGVEQLEELPGCRLALARVRIEKDSDGKSVADLFSAVAISWAASELTEKALGECGISRTALMSYEDSRYSLRELSLYEVGNGFPRITRGSFASGAVPAGTSALRYEVDLSLAAGQRVPHSFISTRLQEVLNA